MSTEERMEQEIRRYVARLRRALGGLEASEIDDIAHEIRGHIAERVEASTDPEATIHGVLEALGGFWVASSPGD